MKKIFVNKKEIQFSEDNLPMLIHGEDHAGASFYTISLVANLFLQGSKVVVLCGYSMAEDQFKKQIVDFNNKDVFYTKEQILDFKNKVSSIIDIDEYIILLKNIELFDEEVVDFILGKKKYIISGDFNKCPFQDKVLEKSFTTKIFFSEFSGIDMPPLNKYEGFFISESLKGVTKLEV
jgi:hypothetical protein